MSKEPTLPYAHVATFGPRGGTDKDPKTSTTHYYTGATLRTFTDDGSEVHYQVGIRADGRLQVLDLGKDRDYAPAKLIFEIGPDDPNWSEEVAG